MRAAEASPGWVIQPQYACPVIDLAGASSVADLVSPRMRRNLRHERNRLAREPDCTIREATSATLACDLAALFRLHGRRWSERGEAGVLTDERIRRFHAEVADAMLGRGLVLRVIQRGARIIGCHYGFRSHETEAFYIGGFDPEWRHLSPGKMLVAEAIDAAIAAGVARFDFLRGSESYKYDWSAEDTQCVMMKRERPMSA